MFVAEYSHSVPTNRANRVAVFEGISFRYNNAYLNTPRNTFVDPLTVPTLSDCTKYCENILNGFKVIQHS